MEAMRKQLLIIFLVYGLISIMCSTSCNGEPSFKMEPCIGEVCTFACNKVSCGPYLCPGGHCRAPYPPLEPYWTCQCLARIGN
ncbi:hypothetical protein ABFS83_07G073700 [Erythranthe nasuta]